MIPFRLIGLIPFILFLFLWPMILTAQVILVQPYLQNATPTSIVIMWETDGNTESQIRYGTSLELGNSAGGTSMTTLGSTILHSVTLTNLTPQTKYYYKATTGNWQSDIFDFVTPPLRESEQGFNIVLMSDMQKDGGNPNIFNDLINTSLLPYIQSEYGSPLSEHLQMTLIPGDVVDNGNAYLQWKNDFFTPGQILWRSVPCYPAIGNHEANSQNYFNYYTLPSNGTPGYLEHWYWHDYSNVRVFSFDSNNPYRIQAQLNWLDSMLIVSCGDTLIDFVFAQMHHPYKSELWTPGETDYTGEIVERLENFSDDCGKPTVHFFGHTHAYSRGQSRDHDHLWVNVATSGGNIDYWGEFNNEDYDEFIVSQDEYGFVMVEVTAGHDPQFVLKRLSFGDQFNPGGNEQTDFVTIRKNNFPPSKPYTLFPGITDTVSASCLTMKSDGFDDIDGDEHGASHWQVSTDSANFSNPVFDSWKQYANWYDEADLQANDDLTDVEINNLPFNTTLWWRVRYRDKSLEWSEWSNHTKFFTRTLDTLSGNLVVNFGAESGISSWTATTGVIESLSASECTGINPYAGQKYFAVGALCVEHPFASAYQHINVNAYAGQIDSGLVTVHYGAYMADWQNTDEPSFALQFLNASNQVIASSDTTRHRMSAWTLKEKNVSVPIGTRTIKYIVMGTRFSGLDNDSYIDNIFLELLSGDVSCSEYQPPGPQYGRVYVDEDSPAHSDGKSWVTAYKNLGDALQESNGDPSVDEIWMAEGIYPVTSNAERDTAFFIERGVSIYGGFNGTETLLSERNSSANPVLLTGETGDTTSGSDNTYHVISVSGTTDTVLLDGLKICCGYADAPADDTGGGIFISNSNTGLIMMRRCTLYENFAEDGSAIFNAAEMQVDNSQIIQHSGATGIGHLILNSGPAAHLTILNSILSQQCTACPETIHNSNGAFLIFSNTVILEND